MPTPPFLVRLLQTRGFAGRKGAEDAEALKFAMEMRKAALELRLKCLFAHPPLEVMRNTPQCALAAAMGAIDGISDYLLLARDGAMALEFKSATGRLQPIQRDFSLWCEMVGVPFHLVRSADQALSLVKARGWLAT